MNKTMTMLAGGAALALSTVTAQAANAHFGTSLTGNTTGLAGTLFLGAPDGSNLTDEGVNWSGIGGQVLTYFFDSAVITDGLGADLNVYEVDFGGSEFNAMVVSVSEDGTTFVNIDASQTAVVPVDNDPGHVNDIFARAFDLAGSGLSAARYVRIDGNGTSAAGGTNGFDLDAIGAVNFEEIQPIPLPAAAWLFGSALAGLAGLRRRSKI